MRDLEDLHVNHDLCLVLVQSIDHLLHKLQLSRGAANHDRIQILDCDDLTLSTAENSLNGRSHLFKSLFGGVPGVKGLDHQPLEPEAVLRVVEIDENCSSIDRLEGQLVLQQQQI